MTEPDHNQPQPPRAALLPLVAAALSIAILAALVIALVTTTPASTDADPTRSPTAATDTDQLASELDRARSLLTSGQAEQAAEALRTTVERFPQQPAALLLLADASFASGDPAAAHDAAERAIPLADEHPEIRFAAAMYALHADRTDAAILHLRKAQQLEPANPKYPWNLASILHAQGNHTEAKVAALTTINLDDSIPNPHSILAQIALDEGRNQVALHHARRARELAPNVPAHRLVEARVLRRMNRPEEAADTLYAIPEFERRTSPIITHDLATALLMLNEHQRAADAYAAAASANPDDALSPLRAARLFAELDRPRAAIINARLAQQRGNAEAQQLLDTLAEQ